MVRLTEDMIVGRTRVSDLASVRKLNCWGADLTDISVLRLLDQVEVLSLSVNNITSLEDIQHCCNLKELFVRKNKIAALSEVLWLRPLRKLSSLMLSENPCSEGNSVYRHTVLRTLPQLKKLDNVEVTPEEMAMAMRHGLNLEEGEEVVEVVDYHVDDDGEDQLLPQQQGTGHNLQMRRNSTLVEGSRRSSFLEEQLSNEAYQHQQQSYSGGRLSYYNDHQQVEDDCEGAISPNNNFCSPPHNHQHLLRGGSEVGVEGGQRRQSRILEDQSGRYSRLLEEQPGWPGGQLQQLQHHQQHQHQQQHQYHQLQQQQHIYVRGLGSQIAPPRPKNRNSNMLSAILCLIKEIDGPSLEVVELAARCRMEELDD